MNEITFHYRHWQTSMNFDTVQKWSIRMVDNARRFFFFYRPAIFTVAFALAVIGNKHHASRELPDAL